MNIKNFLWITETEMLKLRVEAYILGSKVGDSKGRRNSGASEHDDIFGLLDKFDRIIDGVVLLKLNSLGKFTAYGQTEEIVISVIRCTFQERRWLNAKTREQFLCSNSTGFNCSGAKLLGTKSSKLLSKCNSLFKSAVLWS
jgi:hypothetical protein